MSKFNCFYRLRIHGAVYHPFESDFKIVQPMMISLHMYFDEFLGDLSFFLILLPRKPNFVMYLDLCV